MNQTYDWIPFYEEFATKLLEYKDNRAELFSIIKDLTAQNSLLEYLHFDRDDWWSVRNYEIDPFSIFAIFNRSLKAQNRIGIISLLAETFDLHSPIPTDFSGIPVMNNQQAFFAGNDEVWALFEEALSCANNGEFRQKFEQCFENAINVNGNGLGTITMGLFWIRPNVFLNLDKQNREFLSDDTNGLNGVVEHLPKDIKKYIPNGQEYILMIKELTKLLNSGDFEFDTISKMSHCAWVNKPENESDEKSENISKASFLKWFTPLIQALKDLGGSATPKEAIAKIAENENLSEDILNETRGKSEMKKFDNEVNWARNYLVYAGIIDKSVRGIWTLTQQGYQVVMTYEIATQIFRKKWWIGNDTTVADTTSKKRYWMFSAGLGACKWEEFYDNGIMAVGWDSLGSFEQYSSRDEIKIQLQLENDNQQSYINDSLAVWQFANEMNVGDVVFSKKGLNTILGRGVVESKYIYDESIEQYKHIRKVNWTHKGEYTAPNQSVQKTLTDLTQYTEYIAQLEALFLQEDNQSSPNYWWLTANPKIWSFYDIKVGETQSYSLYNDNGNKRRIFKNFMEAKTNDIIVVYESSPVKKVVGFAKVVQDTDGENFFFEKTSELKNPIEYQVLKDNKELEKTEYFKNPQGSLFKLTIDEYNTIMDMIDESTPIIIATKHSKKYTKSDFLSEVFIEDDNYTTLTSLLLRKKNIILQGAPGVGKTFAAKRLAYSMMEEKDDSRVETIQFHQSYSYEDFIMGYRPDGEGFKLEHGVFYKFCKKAQDDKGRDYFFIIDEINRGNLSKIFGELFMLVEHDKRGEENSIRLLYANEQFYIPENVHIIGMMNTADRSLAMLDYALRRRFAFYEMQPAFDSDGFKKYKKSIDNEKFNKLIKVVKSLNDAIETDGSLGAGFRIGHSYFIENKIENINDTWLYNVVNYEIIPLLQEYWFDEKTKVEHWTEKLQGAIK